MQKTLHQHQRAYCKRCQYPQPACICHAVVEISCNSQITILQHPSEVAAAKNTARLLKLAIPTTQIWVGETEEDFLLAKAAILNSTLPVHVIYPSDNANVWGPDTPLTIQPRHFVLLDGTWKKAYKLWQLNTWLHALPPISICGVISGYQIRKAPKASCLSTLEAAAVCLTTGEAINCDALLALFEARQNTFLQHQQ